LLFVLIFIIPLTILSDDEIIYYLAPLCKLGFFKIFLVDGH